MSTTLKTSIRCDVRGRDVTWRRRSSQLKEDQIYEHYLKTDGPPASKIIYVYCRSVKDDPQIEQARYRTLFIHCVLDVVKWRQRDAVKWRLITSINSTLKGRQSRQKRRPLCWWKGQPNCCLIYLCMPETKRERVAHWLSVFYIVIFDFDKLWYDSLNSL